MKSERYDHEDAEEEDLDKKARDDDLLANVQKFKGSRRLDASPHRLDEKRDAVTSNEQLGKPSSPN